MGRPARDEALRLKAELKAQHRQEKEDNRALKRAAHEEKQVQRRKEIEARKQMQVEQDLRNRENYGSLLLEEVCAGKLVRLYDKCYVRVSGAIFGKGDAPFEKLMGISSSADIQKKTGIGRAVAAAATGGASLILTTNRRGDMYLTIVTDRRTHKIHRDKPLKSDLKAMHSIVATGQALLDSTAALHVTTQEPIVENSKSSSATAPPDVVDKLQQLADLYRSGALTSEEFENAKAQLFGNH